MAIEEEYTCANCEEHEDVESKSWQIYCKYYKTFYDKTESCDHLKRIEKSEGFTWNWYITTMICNLLNLPNDNKELVTLSGLRTIMENNPNYKDKLEEYDIVGPKIAKCLSEDSFARTISLGLFYTYIQPTKELIDNKNYEEAINKYMKMTGILKEYYGVNKEEIEKYPVKKIGSEKNERV